MLLEKLVEYANVQMADDLPPAGYQSQPIRYVLDIADDGTLLGVVDTASKDEKRGMNHLAPHVKRGIKIKPKLLADNAEYVLGMARNDPKKPPDWPLIVRRNKLFRELVQQCATETGDLRVATISTFLESFSPESLPDLFPADFDPGATITFRVGGNLPIDDPGIRRWWASSRAPEEPIAGGGISCIVCGTVGAVLERHPLKIKRIPGSMTIGYDLISANSQSFVSYGLTASKTAPTCATCAEAYGNSLNSLLENSSTSLWSGNLAYVFWTDPREPDNPFMPVPFLKDPAAVSDQVAKLLRAAHRGTQDPIFLDPTAFYCVALGSSGARVVVKDWIDSTVGHAQATMAHYFSLQEMVEWNGEPGEVVSLQRLARSVLRQGAKTTEAPPDVVTQALFRLAIKGTPLPNDVLYMAVRRNRAEQAVSRTRAMLMRMVLEPKLHARGEETTLSGLDPERQNPAYLCGRLLAIINEVQEAAIPGVNSSVVDKYYGSSSANPGLVFGFLLEGAQKHLKRLRRDNPGAAMALEARMDEVTTMLDRFPRSLNLEQQGEFGLGFYHQRAASRAARRAASEAKRAQAAAGETRTPTS